MQNKLLQKLKSQLTFQFFLMRWKDLSKKEQVTLVIRYSHALYTNALSLLYMLKLSMLQAFLVTY